MATPHEKQVPVLELPLAERMKSLEESGKTRVLRTRSRKTKVLSDFVGHTLAVFNGQGFTRIHVTQETVGRTLGKVVPYETPTARTRFVSFGWRRALIRWAASLYAVGQANQRIQNKK